MGKLPTTSGSVVQGGKKARRSANFLKRLPSLKEMKNTLLRQGSSGDGAAGPSSPSQREPKRLARSKTVVEVCEGMRMLASIARVHPPGRR